MTNIIQVQNRLKSVPDETLISEIQKPTGQAPSFLVLNELNRRKNDRAEYARRQEEGPQTTVAEDIVKPPAPPAGIGALRPPQAAMSPQAMAPRAAGPQMAMASPMPTPRQATMPGQGVMPGQGAMPGQPIRMNRGGQIQRFDTGSRGDAVRRPLPLDALTVDPATRLGGVLGGTALGDETNYLDLMTSSPNRVGGGGPSSPELERQRLDLLRRLDDVPSTQIDMAPFKQVYTDELAAVKEGRSDARARGLFSAGLGILDRASQYGASQKGLGFLAGAQPAVSEYEKALAGLATRGTAAQRGMSELGLRAADLTQRRETAARENIMNRLRDINTQQQIRYQGQDVGTRARGQQFDETKFAKTFPLQERKVTATETDVKTKKAQAISKWRADQFSRDRKWQAQSNVQDILKAYRLKEMKKYKDQNLSKEGLAEKLSVKEVVRKVKNPMTDTEEEFTFYETGDPDILRKAFLAADPQAQSRIKAAQETRQLHLTAELRQQRKDLQALQTLQESKDPKLRYLDQDPKMAGTAMELIIKYNIKKHKALSQTGDRGDKARAEFLKKFEDPAFRLQIKEMIQRETTTGENIIAAKESIKQMQALKRQGLGVRIGFEVEKN